MSVTERDSGKWDAIPDTSWTLIGTGEREAVAIKGPWIDTGVEVEVVRADAYRGAVDENERLKRVVSRIPQAQLIRIILDIEAEDAASPGQ